MNTQARRAIFWGTSIAVFGLVISAVLAMTPASTASGALVEGSTRARPVSIAVLGDSDSQSYHDSLWVGVDGSTRGGAFRATTFQWGEILARLRGSEIDFGRWGVWGSRRSLVRVMDWFGVHARTPRKEDFEYNFAFAGAHCSDLMQGNLRQAPRLAALMDTDAERWRSGIVVIRIGVNSFGMASNLDAMAANPASQDVTSGINACLADVEASVKLIRATHPTTRFVLVGILNNADFPPWFDKWRSPSATTHIARALDTYDQGLKKIAASGSGIAFFDDRAWFAQRWGQRDQNGMPDYKVVQVGSVLLVRHAVGDHPGNSVLEDGHAGLVWNTLWAQSLVTTLNDKFGAGITPISDAAVADFVARQLAAIPHP